MGKKQERLAIELNDLKERCGKDVVKDLAKFKLEAAGEASIKILSEEFAASNLGLGGRRELDYMEAEGVSPDPEINAWRRVITAAAILCEKFGLDCTNENVILLSHHKKAHSKY